MGPAPPLPSRVLLPARCGEVTVGENQLRGPGLLYIGRADPTSRAVQCGVRLLCTGSTVQIPRDGERRRLWPDSRGPAPDRTIWGKRCCVSQKRQTLKPVTETLIPQISQSLPNCYLMFLFFPSDPMSSPVAALPAAIEPRVAALAAVEEEVSGAGSSALSSAP